MATYGKRKKSLMSAFAVFQDDGEQDKRPKQNPPGASASFPQVIQMNRSTYLAAHSRLDATNKVHQRSQNHARADDESIDELAGDALLSDIPQQPMRAASLHRELRFEDRSGPERTRQAKAFVEDVDKPLPPIPSMDSKSNGDQKTRPALTAKTTNLKLKKNGSAPVPRPKISPPTLQSATSSPARADSRPATSHSVTTLSVLQTTATDPVDLNRKISYLMQQAATQEAESKRRAAILAEASAKPSPLQRCKKAFAKANRVLKDRLSNGSTSEKGRAHQVALVSSPSSASDAHLSPNAAHDENHRKGRFDRRVAEGANLKSPKIQSLTGDGNVPRKPLPIYESMRSRVQQSTIEDPFSDDHETKGSLAPQGNPPFDFSFDKQVRKNKTGKLNVSSTIQDQTDDPPSQIREPPAIPHPTLGLPDRISGLAQHSDTMYFSSSPVSQSTPYDHLVPRPMTAREQRLTILARSPSILEFSFEGQSEDGHSVAPSTASKTVTDGSHSVKRKSAQENLRSPAVPATKKAKISNRLSRDEAANLSAGISSLETEDQCAPLSPKDKTVTKSAWPRQVSKGKGLAIFDLGKGKAPEARQEGQAAKKERPKGFINKRASFPRPSSRIFGRESRAGNRKFSKLDDDMDIDELA